MQVETETVNSPDAMIASVALHEPNIIICPYMTRYIPEAVFCNPHRPCMVVHPGIAGDRGSSSLDWAILEKKPTWGVTVLQAKEILDSGDIWSTSEFKVPTNVTKTALYVHEVSDHAVDCVVDAVSRYSQNYRPVPCNYSNSEIKGNLKRNMKKSDRIIDWNMTAEEIARRVRMSDTQPGAVGNIKINGADLHLRLFDAHEESGEKSEKLKSNMLHHEPGQLMGWKDGAVLIKAGDDKGVWIGQMKKVRFYYCIQNNESIWELQFSSQCWSDDFMTRYILFRNNVENFNVYVP